MMAPPLVCGGRITTPSATSLEVALCFYRIYADVRRFDDS